MKSNGSIAATFNPPADANERFGEDVVEMSEGRVTLAPLTLGQLANQAQVSLSVLHQISTMESVRARISSKLRVAKLVLVAAKQAHFDATKPVADLIGEILKP
jgi:hypothetical protein